MTGDDLWVRLHPAWSTDPERRWLILGNAFTHRGRFAVAAIGADEYASVDLGDVADCSAAARLWLDGFLVGQQATLAEFLGSDDELYAAADEADVQRWHDWNERFRQRGIAPRLDPLPPRDLDLSDLTDPEPWAHVGGRFRVYADGRWAVASVPTTTPYAGFWPGSRCATRRHHRLVVRDPVAVCEDCHWVSG